MRLPDPVIPHPYREIEVSRPDPNMFLEHEDGVTEHNTEIHNHVIHNYEQRQAAMESGVPLDILQGIQNAAQSMANSAELFAAGSPEGIPSGVPVISLPEMDHDGRRQLIQELKQHHTEVMERHARQMHASLGEAVQKMAQNAAEIQAKKEYAAQHEAMMKPFQSMHQTHLDAMTQLMGALQQQQSQNAANAAQGAENHAASLLLQKLLAQQGDALAELIGRTGNVSDAGVQEAMRKAASDQTFRDAQLAAYLTNQGQMLGDALQRVAKPQPQAEVDYEKIGKTRKKPWIRQWPFTCGMNRLRQKANQKAKNLKKIMTTGQGVVETQRPIARVAFETMCIRRRLAIQSLQFSQFRESCKCLCPLNLERQIPQPVERQIPQPVRAFSHKTHDLPQNWRKAFHSVMAIGRKRIKKARSETENGRASV